MVARSGRFPVVLVICLAAGLFIRCACTDSQPPVVVPEPSPCGNSCAQGEACVADRCLPTTCSASPCRADEVCLQEQCVARACVGVQCPSGQVCANGLCQPRHCSQGSCGARQVCIDGQCQDVRCVGHPCPQGEACANGACYPTSCSSGTCAAGQVCVAGECVDKECVDVTCQPGTRCAQGQCTSCDPGYYEKDGACVPQEENGNACTGSQACSSGHCVDGVCCESDCDGPCQSCAATPGTCSPLAQGEADPQCGAYACGAAGQCETECTNDTQCQPDARCFNGVCEAARPDGTSCTEGRECASGFCEDGVCCGSDCAGACDTCNQPDNPGTCLPMPAGSAGAPACAPYVCDGTHSECLTTCGSDAQCDANSYCQQGSCVPRFSPGESCTRAEQCLSSHCVDGVCCDTACEGACDTCSLPGSVGTCSSRPRGSEGQPSCAPYLCTGEEATCPTTCVTDDDCASGNYCHAGICEEKQPTGTSCSGANQCASGQCADGVCCNNACEGECDACNLAGSVGTCSFTPSTVLCRASAGVCDVAEYCSGMSATCPADGSQPSGAACGSGMICNASGQCLRGCWIAGAYYAEGATNPSGPCQECNPSLSTSNWSSKSAGASCNDGNACTTGDVCNGAGTCSGTALSCNSPPNQCYQSTGTCSNGTCIYASKPAGTSCNDGNACTTGDVCNGAGSCGGTALSCNSPPNQCYQSTGTCSNGTCSYSPKPSGTSCNDGNACTTGDVCNGAGTCSGTALTCNNPPNQCYQSTGTCSNGTCSYTPKSAGTSCNDGNACTTGDVCNGAGTCSGTALTCNSPPNQCYQSTGTCSNGTCSYAPKSAGSSCNDGNACTTGDVCNGAGSCGGTALTCNNPPNQCYQPTGTCSNGTCSYTPKSAGTSCNDGNACTTGDVCNGAGTCSGTALTCNSPPNQCYQPTGTCSNGTCSYAPKSAGTSCNDGNACTTGDVCNGAGTCSGTALTCNSPPNQCYQPTGACSNGTCSYAPKSAGSNCNDGNACTTGDVCNGAGTCSGTALTCNSPPNQCYQSTGTCSNGTCSYPPMPAGTSCSDGDACTLGDTCNGSGVCRGTPKTCNPGFSCVDGRCECTFCLTEDPITQ